jgi:hypothetical protein
MTQTMRTSRAEVERLYAEYQRRRAETDAAKAVHKAKAEAEREARRAWMVASEDYFAA